MPRLRKSDEDHALPGLTSPPEKQLQAWAVADLTKLGFEVKQIGHKVMKVKCPHGAYFFPNTGFGNDEGVADLAVTHTRLPQGMWFMIELKAAKTRIREEQKRLIDLGRNYLVRNDRELVIKIAMDFLEKHGDPIE